MKDFFCAIRTAALFIGTVIGAGFATGEEIRLYFWDVGVSAPVVAGVLYGVFCYVFLAYGDYDDANGVTNQILNVAVYISSLITVISMTAAAEKLLLDAIHVPFGGVLTGIVSLFTVTGNTDRLKRVNVISVLSIITVITLVFIRSETTLYGTDLGVPNAVLYVCMNMICAGKLISREGRGMPKRVRVLTSVITGCVMGGLVILIYALVNNTTDTMPFVAVAEKVGLGVLAVICVFLAIFTTHIGALRLTLEPVRKMSAISVVGILLLFEISSLVGFSNVVSALYPIVGVLGALYTLWVSWTTLRARCKVKCLQTAMDTTKNRFNG